MVRAMVVLGLVACSGGGTTKEDALATAEDASAAAASLTGGEAGAAEQVSEDGYDLWEVPVGLSNGAELEVLLIRSSGELFEVKDEAGPFDYSLDVLPGQLTYDEAKAIALELVAGEQQLWEVKLDGDRYFYEFYVTDSGDQLWELKLWADDGEVFVTEAVDEAD